MKASCVAVTAAASAFPLTKASSEAPRDGSFY